MNSPGPASATGTPPLSAVRKITPKMGPNGRMMVKSYSQDASSNMAAVAASAAAASSAAVVTTASTTNVSAITSGPITSSVSDTHLALTAPIKVLTAKPPLPHSAGSSISSVSVVAPSSDATLTSSASQHSLRPPPLEEETYSAASDSGSMASELDSVGKKEKKKRSFFNFRRKKEKIP